MSIPLDDPRRREIIGVLENLRQSYLKGMLDPYKQNCTEDFVVLGIGDVRVHVGMEGALDYLRLSAQKGWMRYVRTRVEDVKILGNVAIVVEIFTTEYMVKGESFRGDGRATSVLVEKAGRWLVTHIHMETLATNLVS